MVLVKILGGIDLASAFAFLLLAFGVEVFTAYLLFCSALLFTKSLFILTGDVLSIIDLLSSILLILSILSVSLVFAIGIGDYGINRNSANSSISSQIRSQVQERNLSQYNETLGAELSQRIKTHLQDTMGVPFADLPDVEDDLDYLESLGE